MYVIHVDVSMVHAMTMVQLCVVPVIRSAKVLMAKMMFVATTVTVD